MGQPQDRAHRPVRSCHRPGRGLVHGPVLRPVLPPEHPEGRPAHLERADRLVADHRYRRLHLLRLAVGQDRPQADDPRRLPDRGDHLLPALRRPHERGQPAPQPGSRDGEGPGRGRSGHLRLGVRSGGHPYLHRALRRRSRGARPLSGQVRTRSRCPPAPPRR